RGGLSNPTFLVSDCNDPRQTLPREQKSNKDHLGMQVVSRGTVMRAWSSGLFHVEHFWFPPEPVRRGGVPPLYPKDCSTWNTLKVTRVDRQGNTRFRPARLPDRLCREQCRSLEAQVHGHHPPIPYRSRL